MASFVVDLKSGQTDTQFLESVCIMHDITPYCPLAFVTRALQVNQDSAIYLQYTLSLIPVHESVLNIVQYLPQRRQKSATHTPPKTGKRKIISMSHFPKATYITEPNKVF